MNQSCITWRMVHWEDSRGKSWWWSPGIQFDYMHTAGWKKMSYWISPRLNTQLIAGGISSQGDLTERNFTSGGENWNEFVYYLKMGQNRYSKIFEKLINEKFKKVRPYFLLNNEKTFCLELDVYFWIRRDSRLWISESFSYSSAANEGWDEELIE